MLVQTKHHTKYTEIFVLDLLPVERLFTSLLNGSNLHSICRVSGGAEYLSRTMKNVTNLCRAKELTPHSPSFGRLDH